MKVTFLAIIPLLSACSFLNVFDTSDRLDRKDGVVLDTPKNREYYTMLFDISIDSEVGRELAPPAYRNWAEFWSARFAALRRGNNENPDFYINYIREKRAEKGLDPI